MWRITHSAIENASIVLPFEIDPATEEMINEDPDIEVEYWIDNKWMPCYRETANSPR
jgi:hypothetical protein